MLLSIIERLNPLIRAEAHNLFITAGLYHCQCCIELWEMKLMKAYFGI